MTEHTLVGLIRTADTTGTPTPGRPLFVCSCKDICAGVDGQQWAIVDSPDGKRALSISPSVNWPEHFHAYFADIPYTTYDEVWPEVVKVRRGRKRK